MKYNFETADKLLSLPIEFTTKDFSITVHLDPDKLDAKSPYDTNGVLKTFASQGMHAVVAVSGLYAGGVAIKLNDDSSHDFLDYQDHYLFDLQKKGLLKSGVKDDKPVFRIGTDNEQTQRAVVETLYRIASLSIKKTDDIEVYATAPSDLFPDQAWVFNIDQQKVVEQIAGALDRAGPKKPGIRRDNPASKLEG